jgi:hypothetical protein
MTPTSAFGSIKRNKKLFSTRYMDSVVFCI